MPANAIMKAAVLYHLLVAPSEEVVVVSEEAVVAAVVVEAVNVEDRRASSRHYSVAVDPTEMCVSLLYWKYFFSLPPFCAHWRTPQLTPKYPNKATGREELGEAGYRQQQQPDGKHELSSSSSMKYQDYPIERSYKDEKGGKESEEDEEEKFEIAEKVQQRENKQHATAARPETLSPPRYSQVFKN